MKEFFLSFFVSYHSKIANNALNHFIVSKL